LKSQHHEIYSAWKPFKAKEAKGSDNISITAIQSIKHHMCRRHKHANNNYKNDYTNK